MLKHLVDPQTGMVYRVVATASGPDGWIRVEQMPDVGEIVVLPARCSDRELMTAQGALLDVGWDAVECFAARIHELFRVTRPRLEAMLDPNKKGQPRA